ncbi:alpha/beta fold hydrolase [Actibacterium sp. D379-3]
MTNIWPPPGVEERLSRAAAQLRVPCLLVRGTESDLVTQDCVDHFRTCQPDARVFDIQGGGHLMKTQDLTVFCAATMEFLQRGATGSSGGA